MSTTRSQLVRWGNSQAVRISKAVLREASIREDEEVKLTVAEGCITIRPLKEKLTLESLVSRITPKNRHEELQWGPPLGKEIW